MNKQLALKNHVQLSQSFRPLLNQSLDNHKVNFSVLNKVQDLKFINGRKKGQCAISEQVYLN